MPRAIWSGAISFGLVNVPVKLYSATSPKSVRFHQLAARTGARIKQKRVDSSTGEEVPYEEIVKGYELAPDRYVRIEPEELEALDPKATHTIEIEEFVDQEEIDPIFYQHTYYVVPTAGGAKAYRLLLEAMRSTGKVGIGRIVLRSKRQLCALRPAGGVLALTTMLFGDEVLPPERLDELDAVAEAQSSERELAMAKQLVETLAGHFDAAKFKDDYRERVLELIERKASGEQVVAPPPAPQPQTSAPDLIAALEASLEAVRGRGAAGERGAASDSSAGGSSRRRAPARTRK